MALTRVLTLEDVSEKPQISSCKISVGLGFTHYTFFLCDI